jgi:CubicO group peptidase (beta-lactamase class C family)
MKRVFAFSIVLVAVFGASVFGFEFEVASPSSAGFRAEGLAKIKPAMEKHIQDGKLVGGSGLVARNGKIIYAEVWGQRDREKQLPVEHDTIFRIYSMSKPITSVGVMMLVDAGKLQLDDPVSKYLPELANRKVLVKSDDSKEGAETTEVPAAREITIRDLLRHTSGLTYGFFGNSEVDQRYKRAGILITDFTLEDTINKLSEIPLLHQPGSRWHYSVSTDVLGRVIEVVSGQSLDQYFQTQIFEPLGMMDTFFTVPSEKLPRLSQMYVPNRDGGLKPANPLESVRFVSPANRFFSGGGGLCSTTQDYLTFCRMLLNEGQLNGKRLLRQKTVRAMRTDQLEKGTKRSSAFQFGLGFSINQQGVYRWGGAAGTRFFIDPKNKLILIYMVQIKPTGRYEFGSEMERLVYASMTK